MRIVPTLIAAVGLILLTRIADAAPDQSEPPGKSLAVPPTDHALARELERSDLETWLDGFFPYALQQGDIAGAVVVVVKDGTILLEKGYGYADVTSRVPMDPRQTIMGVGSVLGMQRSTFRRPPPPTLLGGIAKNYGLASSGEPLPSNANDPEPTDSPAGSFMSTADDMSRFMLAHLNNGRFDNSQILAPETSQWMHATAFVPLAGAQGIALGFFRNDTNGHRIITHDGDLSGFHSDLQLLLDDGVGFFTSVNSDGTGRLIGAAYAMRASLFSQFMDRYFPAAPPPPEPTLPSAKEHAKLVAGEYQMSRRPGGNLMDAFYLLVRVPITDKGDGTIETPGLLNLRTGRPRTWHEIAPFVWREVGGTARLDVDVERGKVHAWVTDDIGSSFVLIPVSYWYSAALNLPLLAFAAAVLVLQTLLWPVAALVRRRYGQRLLPEGRDSRAFRLTRIAAAIAAAYLLGWMILGIAIAAGATSFDAGTDPWIRVIQLVGLLIVPGLAVAVWNAWLTCTAQRAWWIKAWSIVIPFALLVLLWFSFAFHAICVSLSY